VYLTTALLAVGLLLSNLLLLNVLKPTLVKRADVQLRTTGELVARMPPEPGMDLLGDQYAARILPDGRTERIGGTGEGPRLPKLDATAVRERRLKPFTTGAASGGGEWRVLVVPTSSDGDVLVAVSLDSVNATVRDVRGESVAMGSALLIALTLVALIAIRGGMRPLRRIEETAAAIADGDLSRRVPGPEALNTEVGRLSTALNGMLERIESAVLARIDSEARMRRFVADASHELRTPLAGISGFAELYRMGALPERADIDRTMDRIAREADRLTRLVADLLLLAQLDEHEVAGNPILRSAPMDLRAVAVDALHDLRALDPTRSVTLTGPDGGAAGAAPVLGDEARLRQVVANLVGNTVGHTPPGSPVRIGVGSVMGAEGMESVLEVADQGQGIAAGEEERIFRRFYRVDRARNRPEGTERSGAGLGLAIAYSLVSAHGGSLTVHGTPGGGATFRMRLPFAEAGP
jgi:two-component system OmpR family sensor kinase